MVVVVDLASGYGGDGGGVVLGPNGMLNNKVRHICGGGVGVGWCWMVGIWWWWW